MGMFNKLFKAKTVGLVEANLECYFMIRASIPSDQVTIEGVTHPKQIMAMTATLERRKVGNVGITAYAETIPLIVSKVLESGKNHVSERFVIETFTRAVFRAESADGNAQSEREFEAALKDLLPKYASQFGVNLDVLIDCGEMINGMNKNVKKAS